MVCGYYTAPIADTMQKIPPIIRGDKPSEIEGGVSITPPSFATKKKNPLLLGG